MEANPASRRLLTKLVSCEEMSAMVTAVALVAIICEKLRLDLLATNDFKRPWRAGSFSSMGFSNIRLRKHRRHNRSCSADAQR